MHQARNRLMHEGKVVHFTRGKPSRTKSNKIVYKSYLTSPKKCSRPVTSSFHVTIHTDDAGISFLVHIMQVLPIVLIRRFFKVVKFVTCPFSWMTLFFTVGY